MPRFVLLEHDHPERHWDLLLEAGPVLRAWRLAAPPSPGVETAAQSNFDHRLLYLEYEGPIRGDRGFVTRWDGGSFVWIEDGPGRVVVDLTGGRVRGRLTLDAVGETATLSASGSP